MGMTVVDTANNATQVGITFDPPIGGAPGSPDQVTFSYDLAGGPLVVSGQISTGNAPVGTVYTGLTTVGVFSHVDPNAPIFSNTDGLFTFEYSMDDWIAAGMPAVIDLIFADDFDDGDVQDGFSFFLTCFARGTGIATPGGEVAVETLCIGDLVMTPAGPVPVKWVGRRSGYSLFGQEKLQPVRIRQGALDAGLPARDLVVTADHGMILDGLVINAGALVNGGTIEYLPLAEMADHVTYYHIETEDHDVVFANGAAAETFIDYVGRRAFENFDEYVALYGVERIIPDMPLTRVSSARMVPPAIRARLGGAAAQVA